ncbi:translation initiation factor eIF-2B subunit gamma-like [Hydractinia symbiolongicarpus]|uniref:translation initiation factor eIF-2B subunit gamma-like n=1 Tax=Hydractinia symbiolongicarpus TaxID=13093 RepID=UPI00254D25D7|nr:translation initiation factor eIF-2B subunit gamma-like [Hydractinia symbiolongicarpus]
MAPEFQPVILAGGEGSKMYPLTEDIPKCLLPIGNMPMIWYVVNYLERYGFQDFIVIVRQNAAQKVHQSLQTLCAENSKFELVQIPDDDDVGTADSLRLLKDKVKSDLIIVSCDTITDAPLNCLVDMHRTYDASLTVMMSNRVELQLDRETTAASKNKQRDPLSGIRDIVSIHPNENRLLFFQNEGDLEQENISIKKSTLKRYPRMKLKTDLVDSHLYIMKKWLLDYLVNYEKPESIKSDFIPHVIQKQFSKPKKNNKEQIQDTSYIEEKEIKTNKSTDIYSYCCLDELTTYAREWSGYQGNCLKDTIKCHAYVTDGFSLRVNTLPAYTHMNKQIKKLKDTIAPHVEFPVLHPSVTQTGKTQVGNDCIVGESTTIAANATIKKSVIGKHCIIGSNVRISNCVVMNHVTIEDGCVLQGSIICDRSNLQTKCSLLNCQVSSGQTVKENAELKNESIVQEEMEFDE